MTNIPLEIPPGVVKTDSPNAAKGRFIDSDKVRFVGGRPQKWGGWEKFIEDQFAGIARGAISWANDGGSYNIGIGTHLRLFVIQGGDTLTNITPIAASGNLTDPFDTTSGSAVVTVNDTDHARRQGDYVSFSGATAVGGITPDGEYNVVDVVDTDSYTIEHSASATSTVSGGGGTVAYEYEVGIGNQSTILGLGWGAGGWGEGTWGTPRASSGLLIDLRHWSLAEYGNDLLASPSGGGLYLWREGTDDQAVVVANAPTSIRAMFLTGERFVFLLGTSTPMTVQWPDRDDITVYTAADTNTANTRTLQQGSKLIAGTALEDLTNLVWSDTGVYIFQFTGSDLVYDSRLAGRNCGLVGPLAFTVVNGTAYWMSGHNFHMFNNSVSDIPNAEDIREWVFDNIDLTHVTKIWCGYNRRDNTVIWGYVTQGSEEPDRYVELSLHDYSWAVGTLSRTVMTQFRPAENSVLMVGSDGFIYSHETGTDDDGAAMEAYITYGLYTLARGEVSVDIVGLIPDCYRQTGDLSYEVYTKDRPNSASNFDEQTETAGPTDEIVDIRVSGRHFGMTVRSNEIGGDFALGIPSLELGEGSAGARR